MKKLLFLLIAALLTISLSANPKHRSTLDSQTKSTIKSVHFRPDYNGKTGGSSIKSAQKGRKTELRYNRERLSRERLCKHRKGLIRTFQMILQ